MLEKQSILTFPKQNSLILFEITKIKKIKKIDCAKVTTVSDVSGLLKNHMLKNKRSKDKTNLALSFNI
jgi:hypothetical protein